MTNFSKKFNDKLETFKALMKLFFSILFLKYRQKYAKAVVTERVKTEMVSQKNDHLNELTIKFDIL